MNHPSHEVDVLIIGGGIAGASTAYHLSQYGQSVALLERGEIASQASGINAGSIDALGWGRLPDLQAYLTMGSLEMFKCLQLDMGYDIEFRQSGSLQAIHTEAQYAFSRDRMLQLRANGYCVELLSAREARGLEPGLNPALLGCLYMPLRAQAEPLKSTRALAHAATRLGARVLPGREVIAIQPQADETYRVVTADGSFGAARLVLAAGAWCGQLGEWLGLRIPIVPVRGQMWSTKPLPPKLFHTIASAESALVWHHETGGGAEVPPALTHRQQKRVTRHLYGRQTREGKIIFGGDRQLAGFNTTPDGTGIEVNYHHASEVLPFLQCATIESRWAGVMPFSLDGAPLIGKLPHLSNLYIVSGMASSGFGRGPMAGNLLADYIHTGQRPQVLNEADPARVVSLVS